MAECLFGLLLACACLDGWKLRFAWVVKIMVAKLCLGGYIYKRFKNLFFVLFVCFSDCLFFVPRKPSPCNTFMCMSMNVCVHILLWFREAIVFQAILKITCKHITKRLTPKKYVCMYVCNIRTYVRMCQV